MFNPSGFGEIQKQEQKQPLIEEVNRLDKDALRERYEGVYRDSQAESIRREKTAKREEHDQKLKEHIRYGMEREAFIVKEHSLKETSLDRDISFSRDIYNSAGQKIRDVEITKTKRPLFKKIWYALAKDPLTGEVEDYKRKQEEAQSAIDLKAQEREALKQTLQEKLARLKEDVQKGIPSLSNKDLLEKTRNINQSSRDAIEKTLRELENGERDVSLLAKEANAIVVHAIPLPGWSMKNTAMNNAEIDTESMSPKDKVKTILEQRPDISVSVLGAGEKVERQDMFYPFGFIIDGKLIASYGEDVGTVTDKDARRRKDNKQTLQSDAKEKFAQVANSSVHDGYSWNESIVHRPKIKAILIDETKLLGDTTKGDTVKEYFSPDQEEEVRRRFGDKIVSTGKGIPTTGPHAGSQVFAITRQRSGLEKTLEYADANYKQYPVYIRRQDGIYDRSGNKVNVEDIYS